MSILSHNPQRIKALDIDHIMVDSNLKGHDLQTYLGWSHLVQQTLPSLTSLTFRKTGASSPDEPFDSAREREAFAEVASALEVARKSIQWIVIGSTDAQHGCLIYGIEPNEEYVSQRNFREVLLPT